MLHVFMLPRSFLTFLSKPVVTLYLKLSYNGPDSRRPTRRYRPTSRFTRSRPMFLSE